MSLLASGGSTWTSSPRHQERQIASPTLAPLSTDGRFPHDTRLHPLTGDGSSFNAPFHLKACAGKGQPRLVKSEQGRRNVSIVLLKASPEVKGLLGYVRERPL